jgi:hypothetical protein
VPAEKVSCSESPVATAEEMEGTDWAAGHVGDALPEAVQLSATGLDATGLDAGGDPDVEPVPVAAPQPHVNRRAKNRVLRRISSSSGTRGRSRS